MIMPNVRLNWYVGRYQLEFSTRPSHIIYTPARYPGNDEGIFSARTNVQINAHMVT